MPHITADMRVMNFIFSAIIKLNADCGEAILYLIDRVFKKAGEGEIS